MTHPVTITAPEGLPYIDIERDFDAPVAAVFEAHRNPDLVRRWLGPDRYETEMERWDFTTGGGYRYAQRGDDGEMYRFHGVFHVVRENEFAVQTFEFEGYPDLVSLESLTFVDLGEGRTRLQAHSIYPTMESRDGMVASGMETGVVEGYERLDQILAAG